MEKIKRDFIVKELGSLAVLMVLMAVVLAYLIVYARVPLYLFLVIPLIIAAFVVRMYGQAASSVRRACEQYSELWRGWVEREYDGEHPVYKVAYGEIHLLKRCIVCRNKRRLLLLPTEQIVKVEERFRLVGVKQVPLLRFTMDTGETLMIDFSARHCEAGSAVLSWLIQQLGAEIVEQSE